MITLTTLLVINDCVTLLWFNISVPVPRPYIHSFVELLKKDKLFELFNGCVAVTDMTRYDVMVSSSRYTTYTRASESGNYLLESSKNTNQHCTSPSSKSAAI